MKTILSLLLVIALISCKKANTSTNNNSNSNTTNNSKSNVNDTCWVNYENIKAEGVEIDKNDTKWFVAAGGLYSFDSKWNYFAYSDGLFNKLKINPINSQKTCYGLNLGFGLTTFNGTFNVQDSINSGRAKEEKGPNASRNMLQTITLLDALEELKTDAAMGGARRDEEKARAKERFFSHRDEFGQWDPKNQRPELWMLLNGRKHQGEHFRVFPLSNWTEMDVWMYIAMEKIDIPNIYFTHQREIVMRDGMLLANSEYITVRENEKAEMMTVRFRTIGDMTCTGAVLSPANSLQQIIEEVAASKTTERGTRSDDKRSETAMEDRKKAGYF